MDKDPFYSAYLHASATQDLAPLKLLLEQGTNINQVFYKEAEISAKCWQGLFNVPPAYPDHGTLLCCAIRENKLWLAQFLLDNKADVNQHSVLGQTPLSLALDRTLKEPTAENLEFVRMLIERGAMVDKKTRWEYEMGGENGLKLLAYIGGKNPTNKYESPIKKRIESELWDYQKELQRPPVIKLLQSAMEILFLAAEGVTTDHIPDLERLLESEALSFKLRSVNGGKTPLHLACENGQINALIAMLRVLRKKGLKEREEILLATDSNGKTPLRFVAKAKKNSGNIISLDSIRQRVDYNTFAENAIIDAHFYTQAVFSFEWEEYCLFVKSYENSPVNQRTKPRKNEPIYKERALEFRKRAKDLFNAQMTDRMSKHPLLWTDSDPKIFEENCATVCEELLTLFYERSEMHLRKLVSNLRFEYYVNKIFNHSCDPTLYLFEAEMTEIRNCWINITRNEYNGEGHFYPKSTRGNPLSMENFNRLCEAIERSTVIKKLVLGHLELNQVQLLKLFEAISKNNSISTLDINWLSTKTKIVFRFNFEALLKLIENKPNIKEVRYKDSFGDLCSPEVRRPTINEKDYELYAKLPLALERNKARNVLALESENIVFEIDPDLSDLKPKTEDRAHPSR